jgi:hypothetical protein
MKLKTLLIGAVLGLVLLPAAVNVGFYEMTKQTVDVTINRIDKTSDGNYVYLLKDPYEWGMIRNDDNWWILKRNSGVLMGKLLEGGNCNLTVYGWRFTWLSWAPNLVSVNSCSRG